MEGEGSAGTRAETWRGFVDDASPLPGSPPVTRLEHGYVGSRVGLDRDLTLLASCPGPLRVVVSGGAAQVAGPLRQAARTDAAVVAVETALRDPGDPVGNARRVVVAVDAARDEGILDGVAVAVRVDGDPSPGWLAALDELAAAELELVLPLGAAFRGWADAALDRELPFALHGGTVDDAVAALRTTADLWDGPGAPLGSGRRWCRSWPSSDPAGAVERLEAYAERDT